MSTCVKSQMLIFNQDIGSNQVLRNKIPLRRYMAKGLSYINQFNKSNRDYQQKMLCQFKGQRIRDGYPIITNLALFDHYVRYQSVFDSDKPPSTLETIFKYATATIAALADFALTPFIMAPTDQHTFISGPKWGTLTFTASLMVNTPLVLCCTFKEGQIVPEYVGLSKADILDFLQQQEIRSLLGILLFTSITLIACRKPLQRAYRYLKSKLSDLWHMSIKNPKTIRYNPEVEEEQACIICYNKCRNVIFKNCKHMILCHECAFSPENPVTTCPICRENIDGQIELMQAKF